MITFPLCLELLLHSISLMQLDQLDDFTFPQVASSPDASKVETPPLSTHWIIFGYMTLYKLLLFFLTSNFVWLRRKMCTQEANHRHSLFLRRRKLIIPIGSESCMHMPYQHPWKQLIHLKRQVILFLTIIRGTHLPWREQSMKKNSLLKKNCPNLPL